MKTIKLAAMLFAALSVAGCELVQADFRRPGGSVGYLADQILPAPTKRMEMFRAVAGFAFFARVAASGAHGSDGAAASLRYMIAVRNDLNGLASQLYSKCGDQLDKKCDFYPQNFENGLPMLEYHLYKLAVSGLPSLDTQKVISKLAVGDFLGAALDLANTAGPLIAATHQGAATYRSAIEITAAVVARGVDPKLPVPGDVASAKAFLDARAPVANPGAYRNFERALEDPNNNAIFDALYAMVRSSCRDLRDKMTDVDKRGVAGLKIASCEDFKLEKRDTLDVAKDSAGKAIPDFKL